MIIVRIAMHALPEKRKEVVQTLLSMIESTGKETLLSKGFGFVEMPVQAEAQSAIEFLNKKALKGRTITVNKARPHADNRRGKDKKGGRDREGDRDRRGRWRYQQGNQAILLDLYTFSFSFLKKPGRC